MAAVSAGWEHTCGLTTAGGLKCWGDNSTGQLGDGTATGTTAPVDVAGLSSGMSTLSAGREHTCAVTTAGGIKCWGSNRLGQLADPTAAPFRATPVDVEGLAVPVADLSITKSAVGEVAAGDQLGYTVEITNNGPDTSTAVALVDILPSEVFFVSSTPGSPTCEEFSGTLTCNLGSLATSITSTITIMVGVPTTTAQGVTLTNSAAVSSTEPDPIAGNNSSTATTTVQWQADLSITKTGLPDPVVAGTGLTYALTVMNNGPSDATFVTSTDALPSRITFTSATDGCIESAGVVTCNLGYLSRGASTTVTIEVAVNSSSSAGLVNNTASVTSNETDPDTGNNTTSQEILVNTEADLSLTKNDSRDPVIAGTNLNYTLMVTNNDSLVKSLCKSN